MHRVLVNMPSQYGGKPSGVALVTFRLIEHLLERGSVAIVLRSPWTRAQLPASLRERIEVETVERSRFMIFDVAAQLVSVPAACRRHRIDLVLNADPYGAALGGRARVTIVHDLYFRTIPDRVGPRETFLTDLIFRLVLPRSRSVVTVSNTTRRDLERHYPSLRGRTVTVPSASILDAKRTVDAPPVTAHGRYVLAVGNATPNKNFSALAQGIARLSADWPDLGIVHVGQDPQETIAGTLASLGCRAPLIRLGGLDDRALASLYRGALCLCVPSIAEGFCLPVLEAQSLGCPVVCSDRSATPEVAGEGALLFDPDDPQALAACLRRLLTEPDLRAALADRGHENEAGYTWSEAARAYEAVIMSALAQTRPASHTDPEKQAADAYPAS